MREIKFRAWDTKNQRMVYEPYHFEVYHYSDKDRVNQMVYRHYEDWRDLEDGLGWECEIMQFTGLQDKNDKGIYEGDIFRVEEDGAEDGTDMIYHLAVVWIKEWTMFGTLNISNGEYKQYLDNGAKALDEPMFWTYTLEDTNDRRFYLCGNIYQNPELVSSSEIPTEKRE